MNFECHITCRLSDAKEAERVATDRHWKTSQIERDPVLGDHSYFYLTTHSASYDGVFQRMSDTTRALIEAGVTVVRQKIELVVYDTKFTKVLR